MMLHRTAMCRPIFMLTGNKPHTCGLLVARSAKFQFASRRQLSDIDACHRHVGVRSAAKMSKKRSWKIKKSRTKKKFATANEIRRLGGETGVQF
jgi:hypothetical protein